MRDRSEMQPLSLQHTYLTLVLSAELYMLMSIW